MIKSVHNYNSHFHSVKLQLCSCYNLQLLVLANVISFSLASDWFKTNIGILLNLAKLIGNNFVLPKEMLFWNEILLFCNLLLLFVFSGLNPCKNSKFAQFFGNLILSLLFGSYFGEAKNSVILSQNYSFEELMEKLILSNFLVKI